MKGQNHSIQLLQRLDESFRKRNPVAAKILSPGLTRGRILKKLQKMNVIHNLEPLVAWYSWVNGWSFVPGIPGEQLSLIPLTSFCVYDINLLGAHFQGFSEFAEYSPNHQPAARRCFPVLWDGFDQYIGIDVQDNQRDSVIIFDSETEPHVRLLYNTFNDFVSDLIVSNDNGTCLSTLTA